MKEELMVRVVESKMQVILANPYVREMDFTSRPMKEFVFVTPEGFRDGKSLQRWIRLGIEHAKSKLEGK